jgi:hypothetical protein
MFNCGLCNKSSEPGEKAFHVVIQTRDVIYQARQHHDGRRDPGGRGVETVKEVLAHQACSLRSKEQNK